MLQPRRGHSASQHVNRRRAREQAVVDGEGRAGPASLYGHGVIRLQDNKTGTVLLKYSNNH